MSIPTGGPAFPQSHASIGKGMDLRDYFAAKAMQSLLAKDSNWREGWGRCTKTDLSTEAYQFADAMLKARSMEGSQ